MHLIRMDGALIASAEICQDKAVCSVQFQRSTKVFEDMLASGRTAILKLAGAIPVSGGEPVVVDGQIVGAIGVSGGNAPNDAQVAAAGIAQAAKWNS
jgi:glc operon protein GlcG